MNKHIEYSRKGGPEWPGHVIHLNNFNRRRGGGGKRKKEEGQARIPITEGRKKEPFP